VVIILMKERYISWGMLSVKWL